MTSTTAEPTWARRITDGLEPKNWILGVTVLFGARVDGVAGVAWGLFSALFAAVIPILFITYGMKRGRWADRHVGVKQHRLIVGAFIIASVATGIVLMAVLGAPRPMIALIASMLTTLAVLMAITIAWKVSVHAAVSSGSVVLLTIVYGPWMLALYPLVAIVSWSRVELRDHTKGQVLVGTILGAVVAGATYLALR